MEQRDLLKDQIEYLGQILGKIVSKFADLDPNSPIINVIIESNKELASAVDLDIKKLVELESEELEKYVDSQNWTAENLDLLSHYLFIIGKQKLKVFKPESAKNYLNTAIKLLEYASEKSATYSLERNSLTQQIKSTIMN